MNGKPVLVWLLIMAAVVALLQLSSPATSSIQQLGVTQVLSLAQEKKIKTLTVKPDPTGGTDSWYQVAGELEVKGADANDKSKFIASGRLTEKNFEDLRAAVGKDAFK